MEQTVELETQVLDTVASVLSLERSRLTKESTAEQLGVDSLDLIKVTFAIERRFAINLSGYGFQEVNSLGKLVRLVAKHLADENRAA